MEFVLMRPLYWYRIHTDTGCVLVQASYWYGYLYGIAVPVQCPEGPVETAPVRCLYNIAYQYDAQRPESTIVLIQSLYSFNHYICLTVIYSTFILIQSL